MPTFLFHDGEANFTRKFSERSAEKLNLIKHIDIESKKFQKFYHKP